MLITATREVGPSGCRVRNSQGQSPEEHLKDKSKKKGKKENWEWELKEEEREAEKEEEEAGEEEEKEAAVVCPSQEF